MQSSSDPFGLRNSLKSGNRPRQCGRKFFARCMAFSTSGKACFLTWRGRAQAKLRACGRWPPAKRSQRKPLGKAPWARAPHSHDGAPTARAPALAWRPRRTEPLRAAVADAAAPKSGAVAMAGRGAMVGWHCRGRPLIRRRPIGARAPSPTARRKRQSW